MTMSAETIFDRSALVAHLRRAQILLEEIFALMSSLLEQHVFPPLEVPARDSKDPFPA